VANKGVTGEIVEVWQGKELAAKGLDESTSLEGYRREERREVIVALAGSIRPNSKSLYITAVFTCQALL
jgi:hypothetical protein